MRSQEEESLTATKSINNAMKERSDFPPVEITCFMQTGNVEEDDSNLDDGEGEDKRFLRRTQSASMAPRNKIKISRRSASLNMASTTGATDWTPEQAQMLQAFQAKMERQIERNPEKPFKIRVPKGSDATLMAAMARAAANMQKNASRDRTPVRNRGRRIERNRTPSHDSGRTVTSERTQKTPLRNSTGRGGGKRRDSTEHQDMSRESPVASCYRRPRPVFLNRTDLQNLDSAVKDAPNHPVSGSPGDKRGIRQSQSRSKSRPRETERYCRSNSRRREPSRDDRERSNSRRRSTSRPRELPLDFGDMEPRQSRIRNRSRSRETEQERCTSRSRSKSRPRDHPRDVDTGRSKSRTRSKSRSCRSSDDGPAAQEARAETTQYLTDAVQATIPSPENVQTSSPEQSHCNSRNLKEFIEQVEENTRPVRYAIDQGQLVLPSKKTEKKTDDDGHYNETRRTSRSQSRPRNSEESYQRGRSSPGRSRPPPRQGVETTTPHVRKGRSRCRQRVEEKQKRVRPVLVLTRPVEGSSSGVDSSVKNAGSFQIICKTPLRTRQPPQPKEESGGFTTFNLCSTH